jgi:hypothetical protein
VTIQNEVDTTEITKETYEKLYRSLDYYLKREGKNIRDKIKFVGGDLANDDNDIRIEWLDYMGQNMNDILDGYSHHQYWGCSDTAFNAFNTRLTNLSVLLNHMTRIMPEEQRKPIYITEYGTKDLSTGQLAADLVKSAWQAGYYQITALNGGVSGFCRWDAFRASYAGTGGTEDYFAAIDIENGEPVTRPAFYLQKLIAAATVPGSDIIKTTSVAAVNSNKIAALRSPEDKLTLMMSHRTDKSRTLTVDKMEPGKEFYLYYFNEGGDGFNTYKGKITVDEWGRLNVPVNTQAVAFLTETQLPDATCQ